MGRGFAVRFTAALSFSGGLTKQVVATFVAFAGRITKALGGGSSQARGSAERTSVENDGPTTSATGKPGRSRARKP